MSKNLDVGNIELYQRAKCHGEITNIRVSILRFENLHCSLLCMSDFVIFPHMKLQLIFELNFCTFIEPNFAYIRILFFIF
jgi:hypothetical protein